jgi:hypothetical protein
MRNGIDRGLATFIWLLALAAGLVVSGCGTSVVHPEAEISTTDASVYFIRKKYPPYLYSVSLSANGTRTATLANNDYVIVRLPLGLNTIEADVFDGDDLKFDLPVTSDPMYVLMTSDGYETGTSYISHSPVFFISGIKWNLKGYAISKEEAQRVVAEFGKELK